MAERQWLGEQEDEAIQQQAMTAVANAVRFAEQSPFPTPDAALTDVLEGAGEDRT